MPAWRRERGHRTRTEAGREVERVLPRQKISKTVLAGRERFKIINAHFGSRLEARRRGARAAWWAGRPPSLFPVPTSPASKLLAAPRSWPDLARTRMSNRLTVHCRRPWRDRASKRERERMPGSWIIVGLVTAMAAHGRNDRFRRYVYGWGCRNHA